MTAQEVNYPPSVKVVGSVQELLRVDFTSQYNRICLPRKLKPDFMSFARAALEHSRNSNQRACLDFDEASLKSIADRMHGFDGAAVDEMLSDMRLFTGHSYPPQIRVVRGGYADQDIQVERFHEDGQDRYFSVYAGAKMLHMERSDVARETMCNDKAIFIPAENANIYSFGLTSLWKQTGKSDLRERAEQGIQAALHSGQPDDVRMLLVASI